MFGREFKRKYALTDKGVQNVKKGTFWTVIVNLVVMSGISILYLLMNNFVNLIKGNQFKAVSYTHLRAHETEADLVCRLLLEKIFF